MTTIRGSLSADSYLPLGSMEHHYENTSQVGIDSERTIQKAMSRKITKDNLFLLFLLTLHFIVHTEIDPSFTLTAFSFYFQTRADFDSCREWEEARLAEAGCKKEI